MPPKNQWDLGRRRRLSGSTRRTRHERARLGRRHHQRHASDGQRGRASDEASARQRSPLRLRSYLRGPRHRDGQLPTASLQLRENLARVVHPAPHRQAEVVVRRAVVADAPVVYAVAFDHQAVRVDAPRDRRDLDHPRVEARHVDQLEPAPRCILGHRRMRPDEPVPVDEHRAQVGLQQQHGVRLVLGVPP